MECYFVCIQMYEFQKLIYSYILWKMGLKWRVIQKFQFKHSWKTAQNTGNLAELLHQFFVKIIGQENWLNGRCWVKIVETTGLDKTYFNAVTLFLSFFWLLFKFFLVYQQLDFNFIFCILKIKKASLSTAHTKI